MEAGFHTLAVESVLEQFATHLEKGLTDAQVAARREQYGFNELREKPRPGFWKMLWAQFGGFWVRILIVAALISLFLGEWVDASAILAIVVLNAVIGVVQQSRAEQALAALQKMAAPNARVVRDGVEIAVPSRELVPGDIIIMLEAGNYIPADLRLVESVNMKVDEASLTGESVPVNKNARLVLDQEIPIGDRRNSAFMGTLVTYGRGRGLVTRTGMHTEIGMIAEMIQSSEQEPTPLQRKLDQPGKWLGIVSLAICGVVFVYGLLRDTHPGMIWTQGFLEHLRAEQKDIIELFMTAVSLAIAAVPETPTPDMETQLVFVGLLGMIDPARSEVRAAVQVARGAGLKSVMVTGDYRDTAEAIAREIGLRTPGGQVLTGAELDRMTEMQLAEVCEHVDVYARASPAHKIVDALKLRGHIVAMTGDGVNDAPALKRADIGVAMGITGTDVAKETAAIVLTDDNYASIVSAIEEGRIIYANIRKFVYYLISCNIGEILVIFPAMLLGLPIPLTPIMLLWLNLITDGAPALALGMEKGDPDTMKRPPRPTREPVINREMLSGVIVQAVVMTAAVLGAFVYGLNRYPDNLAGAQTMAFATLVVSELLRAYTARAERHALLRIGVWGNKWMQYAVGSSLALLVAVVYVPFLQTFFGTTPLALTDWLLMAPFFLAASVAAEVTKAALRRTAAGRARA